MFSQKGPSSLLSFSYFTEEKTGPGMKSDLPKIKNHQTLPFCLHVELLTLRLLFKVKLLEIYPLSFTLSRLTTDSETGQNPAPSLFTCASLGKLSNFPKAPIPYLKNENGNTDVTGGEKDVMRMSLRNRACILWEPNES